MMKAFTKETSFNMIRQREGTLGFTLVEIMIVIAVAGILAVVTIPKYQVLTDHYHLESSAQMVAGKLRNAKQYAMDRRTDVYVMFNSTSAQLFYYNNDPSVNQYTSLETQQTFDTGVTFDSISSNNLKDIPTNGGSVPLSYNNANDQCLIFDRKGFLKNDSPVYIVLTNSHGQSVRVDLTSESLEVTITWL